MKKLSLIVFSVTLLLVASCIDADKKTSDTKSYCYPDSDFTHNLNGRVKKVIGTSYFLLVVNGEKLKGQRMDIPVFIDSFDTNGLRVQMKSIKWKSTSHFHYLNGGIINSRRVDSTGNVVITNFNYDDNGRILSIIDEDTTSHVRVNYEWESEHEVWKERKNVKGKKMRTKLFLDDDCRILKKRRTGYYKLITKYEYDKQYRVIKEKVSDYDGVEQSSKEYLYNNNGDVIKEIEHDAKYGSTVWNISYKYDSRMNPIETIRESSNEGISGWIEVQQIEYYD